MRLLAGALGAPVALAAAFFAVVFLAVLPVAFLAAFAGVGRGGAAGLAGVGLPGPGGAAGLGLCGPPVAEAGLPGLGGAAGLGLCGAALAGTGPWGLGFLVDFVVFGFFVGFGRAFLAAGCCFGSADGGPALITAVCLAASCWACTAGGDPGIARSIPRRGGSMAATTNRRDSPTRRTSLALRGAGSARFRSGA